MRSALLLLICVSCTATAATQADFGLPIQPIIQPGYQPGSDAKKDERGLWMEMNEAEIDLQRSPLVVRDGVLDDYVSALTCRIAGEYCKDVRVYVIRNPMFNASMAPNGIMLVHTGLLVRATSADEIAAVLGHELAHYTQTHSIKRLRAAKRGGTIGMIVSMGLALGGVNAGGLPEILALSSVMGFTRSQESDADALGAYFMNDAGYHPQAAANLWTLLDEEEENASVKFPKGPLFLSSHPRSDTRAAKLTQIASEITGNAQLANEEARRTATAAPLLPVLQASYELLMDEQLQQRDHGRLNTLLDRHARMGIRATDVAFYRGETWRIRGGAGDHKRAIAQYKEAIEASEPNPRAFRELGYLEYKHGDQELAKGYFREFLARVPDASDREMIEFYLGEGW
ncbi:MAG: M48 family metalloprotease [Pseudomonadota bacterium]